MRMIELNPAIVTESLAELTELGVLLMLAYLLLGEKDLLGKGRRAEIMQKSRKDTGLVQAIRWKPPPILR